MKEKILITLITQLFKLITPEMLKKAVDSLLDKIEDEINESETKIDDATLLPLIKLIRTTFDIPDND